MAELFVFVNATSAKKLELFVWIIEEVGERAGISLDYASQLQVMDM